jgi:uncharacterized protein DUF3606
MPDNKNKQGKQDDRRIDPKDPSEVGYAARKLGTSPNKIHEAIQEVGTSRQKVEKYVKDWQKNR